MQQINPILPKTTPLFKTRKSKVPTKSSILWNAKQQKYLHVEYNHEDFMDILSTNTQMHNNIMQIVLSGSGGTEIASFAKNEHQIKSLKYNVYEEYKEITEVKNNHQDMLVTMPFGGLQKEVCLQKNLAEQIQKVNTFIFYR